MPLPTAVPRCSWKRSIAATMSSLLCVGDCTTDAVAANDTTPMRVDDGCRAMKAFAASCAATRRLGLTSVARMLPETSIARITVSCCDGSVTTAVGRAIATIISVSATQEQQRRHVAPEALAGAHRVLDQREARVTQRALLLPPQQQRVDRDDRRHDQQQPQHLGPQEAHRRAHPRCCGRPPPVASWLRRLRRSAKRRIASTRSLSVDSSSASTPAARKAVRSSCLAPGGGGGEAPAEAAVVAVDEQLLAGLGILHDEEPEVRQLHLHRIVEAHRDHVMALGEVGERLRPPRRADEIGNDEHQRASRHDLVGRAQQVGEVGRGRRRLPRGASPSGGAGAAPGAGRCAPG